MRKCPVVDECGFFNDNMSDMPAMAEKLKGKYCRGRFENCAVFQVKQSTGVFHPTIWPNQDYKVGVAIKEIKTEEVD